MRRRRRIWSTISLCRGRSSIMTTTSWTRLSSALRDDGERFLIGRFQFQIVAPPICMYWITRGP